MSFKDTFFDIAGRLIEFVIQLIQFVFQKTVELIHAAWEWFISLPFIEKLVIVAGVPAVFAVMLPAARFDIFDSVYEVNNPLSHYMVMIGILMFASIFVRHYRYTVLARCGVNVYYFAWSLYYYCGEGMITRADQYTVTPYFFLNFIVPVIYVSLSVVSWMQER